jgi:hypothetical protein
MLTIKYLLEQRRLIYTQDKPLGHLYKLCNPSFHEFKVILSANEFQLVCYTATLFTTEAECKRVNPDWHLAHLKRRRAMICLTRIATGPLIPIGNEGRIIHTPPPPTVFLRKVVREYLPHSYWTEPSNLRDEGQERFSYPVSRAYKCKILKFGFSYWIMSPSVGLTFPVPSHFASKTI